ncbi:MAG: type II secretion system F family protein, partial [Actinomycetota bacterium]|nr:type II secretion system F family protein [Actinomycetota bacterium]
TPGVAATLARLDAGRRGVSQPISTAQPDVRLGGIDRARINIGSRLEAESAARGWQFAKVRLDLAIMSRPFSLHLGTKVLLAVGALVWLPLMAGVLRLIGPNLGTTTPAILTLAGAAMAFFLPDLTLRKEAEERRRHFRHVVGSFLDLVAMNLAGGRGLPEALMAASSVGDHWAMARIRQALSNARVIGVTPWDGVSRLGRELGVEELRDLASALALAGDEGAKIRHSLMARAESMRRKELTDVEGQAGERSQSMLVAQLLICAAFLLFLAYPATSQILAS